MHRAVDVDKLGWTAVGALVAALSGQAAAAPMPGQADAVLRTVEVEARSIRDARLPMDAMTRSSADIEARLRELPGLLPDAPVLRAIEESMRVHAAQLIEHANAPDPIEIAGPAQDLLDDIQRLRGAVAGAP